MKSIFLLLFFLTISLHASSPITASSYATFLNAVAEDDPYGIYEGKIGGSRLEAGGWRLEEQNKNRADYGPIVRSGAPGSYRYDAEKGKGNSSMSYTSQLDILRYCDWFGIEEAESTFLACDCCLKSNRITFLLPECSSSSWSHATMKENTTSWERTLGLFAGIASLFVTSKRAEEELPLLHGDIESYGSSANTQEDHTRQDSRLPDIRRIRDIENQEQVKNIEEEKISYCNKMCIICIPGLMNGMLIVNSVLASQWLPAAYAGPCTLGCYCCCIATSLGCVGPMLLKEIDSSSLNKKRQQMTGAVPPCKRNHQNYSPEVLDAYRPLLREKKSMQPLAYLNPASPVRGLANNGTNCFIHAPLQLCRALNIDINSRSLAAMPRLQGFFADQPRTVADCQALRREIATHLLKYSGNRDLQAVVINGESRSQQDATAFLRLLLQKTGAPPVVFANTLHDQTTGEERVSSPESLPILSLILPAPKATGHFTMKKIIEHNLATETNLRWRECDSTTTTMVTITKALVDPAPESLIISLGRFEFDQTHGGTKRHDTVDEIFAPITLPLAYGNNISYEPIAIICHDGITLNQGHYLCYRKETNQWLVFDDNNEVGIPERSENMQFIKKNATIIAYRKICERS